MLSGGVICPAAAVSFQGFPTPVLPLWEPCDWCLDETNAHKYADRSFILSCVVDEFFCAERIDQSFSHVCFFFKGSDSTYLSKPTHILSCQG